MSRTDVTEPGRGLDFAGAVVCITGAGRGLGRAYALDLARHGARVVVNDLGGNADGSGSDDDLAGGVAREIRDLGGEAVADSGDICDPRTGERMVELALSRWGRLDGVVTNAGILRDRSFAKMTADDLGSVFDVHVRGSVSLLQPAFRAMRDTGSGGRFVLTASPAGLFGNFGQANYAIAKAGLIGLTRVLHVEGERYGIVANAIAPVAATRLSEAASGSETAPERVTPLVLALLHRDCPAAGEVFVAAAGWFARVEVGVTSGLVGGVDVGPEDLLRDWSRLADGPTVAVPRDARDFGTIYRQRAGVKPKAATEEGEP